MKPFIRIIGFFMRTAGYGLIGFVIYSGFFMAAGMADTHTAGAPKMGALMAWLFYVGVLCGGAGAGLYLGGKACAKAALEGGTAAVPPEAPGAGAAAKSVLGFLLRAAGAFTLLVMLVMGAIFARSGMRQRAFSQARAAVPAGAPAEAALKAFTRADRLRVVWQDASLPGYYGGGALVPQPVDGSGKMVPPAALHAEYRLFMFYRKLLDVTFDADGRVSAVKESVLD